MKSSTFIALCLASVSVLGCKDKAQSTQSPVAKVSDTAPAATPLSTFTDAITEFATKGGSDRYEALLSERMKQKYVDAAANSDDPAFKAEIAIRAKELNLPENASMIDIAAAMWHQGLLPLADQMRAAEVELLTDENSTRVHWKGLEVAGERALTITVTKENPDTPEESFKIDEN